jgi:hypothetical protein
LEFLKLIITIATVLFVGWNMLHLILAKRGGLYDTEKVCIAYGLGLAAISFEMFLFYFFNIKFSLGRIILPWVPFFFINMIIDFKYGREPAIAKLSENRGIGILGKFLAFGIAFEILYSLFRALIKPIESYDAIAIYAIKSKIFYLAMSVPANFFTGLANIFPHPDYPLNIPLSETFMYIALGGLNDQLAKIIFPLFFIGILGLVYMAIRRFATSAYALLFTFILASIPQFSAYSANAYTDLPLAYYCFASAICLFMWMQERQKTQFLLLSAVLSGFAGWTKNDGLLYCVSNTLVLAAFILFNGRKINKKEIAWLFIYMGTIFLISLPWLLIKKQAHIVNTEIDLANANPVNLVKQFYKLGPIFYEFQKQFFGPKKWNIIWPVAALAIIFNLKSAFKGIGKYIALSLFLAISGYILFYMISYVDVRFFVGKTWARFLLHFLPLVVYWLAVMLKDEVKI